MVSESGSISGNAGKLGRGEFQAEDAQLRALFRKARVRLDEGMQAEFQNGLGRDNEGFAIPVFEFPPSVSGIVDEVAAIGDERAVLLRDFFRDEPLVLAGALRELAVELQELGLNSPSLFEEGALLRLSNLPANADRRISELLEAGSDLEEASPRAAIEAYEQAIALCRELGDSFKPQLISSIRKLVGFLDFMFDSQAEDEQFEEDETLQLLEKIRLQHLEALGPTEDHVVKVAVLRQELNALTGGNKMDAAASEELQAAIQSLLDDIETERGEK